MVLCFCFNFYKSSKKDRICASALGKDHHATLFNFAINTLNLCRNKYKDEKFNSKTFGYSIT